MHCNHDLKCAKSLLLPNKAHKSKTNMWKQYFSIGTRLSNKIGNYHHAIHNTLIITAQRQCFSTPRMIVIRYNMTCRASVFWPTCRTSVTRLHHTRKIKQFQFQWIIFRLSRCSSWKLNWTKGQHKDMIPVCSLQASLWEMWRLADNTVTGIWIENTNDTAVSTRQMQIPVSLRLPATHRVLLVTWTTCDLIDLPILWHQKWPCSNIGHTVQMKSVWGLQ